MAPAARPWQRPLLAQLGWFISLRWIAGAAVIGGALLDWKLLRWYGHPAAMAGVGLGIVGYNLGLWLLLRQARRGGRIAVSLLALAWLQLLLDLGCLSLLTVLSGGFQSPLLGFFVFHMVFASLLLPRAMAYASAALAIAMFGAGLLLANRLPAGRIELARAGGWAATLLLTVWLTSRITRSLRRQRRRLLRQNRRIREMSRRLQQQHRGMVQQEKMAAVGQLAAGVAHEIANPLASIDGLLQLASRKPEKLRPELIATLREQVNRINQILRQMTTFAHPGEGTWQSLDLNAVVDKALAVVQYDPRLKRIRLERRLADRMPQVRLIAEAMQQVIINLILNALDAMADSPDAVLTIRTDHGDSWCSVSVQDNGHGITAEHRRRLFEPFFTTKPVGKGTGLGLSISYSLVQNHGGKIVVESRPGQGAQFTVRLPAPAQTPAPGTPAAAHT